MFSIYGSMTSNIYSGLFYLSLNYTYDQQSESSDLRVFL